jgi:hypothetical protein
LVEQLICNQLVGGSSPSIGSSFEEIGDIPERLNGADCKSAGYTFGGSNPSVPTFTHFLVAKISNFGSKRFVSLIA